MDVLNPVLRVFIGGFKLPLLTTLQNPGSRYEGFSAQRISALPLFALTATTLYGLWSLQLEDQST